MTILDRLLAVPGTYWGSGDGPHSGPFIARITVKALLPATPGPADVADDADGADGADAADGAASGSVELDYEAWTQGAGLQHAERAAIRRTESGHVVLESTLAGQAEPLAFQEGQPGVFGSLDGQQVGVVIDVRDGILSWAWWWTAEDEQLKEQSRAVVRRLLEPRDLPEPEAPSRPAEPQPATAGDVESAAPAPAEPVAPVGPPPITPVQAPWPGVLVLTGMGGVAALARDLAKEVPSAAIVRGDLLARAIVGTEVGDDRNGGAGLEWRSRLAARLSREYAELGHAVVLAELESSGDSAEALLMELDEIGVGPVRLLVVDETTTAHDVLAELPRPGRRRSL
jgi:hypothetical protein